MEPVILGFFLGLIGAGVGAWFADFFQRRRTNDLLRRSLVSELHENRAALLRKKRTRLHRSAWDAARGLPLSDKCFRAVSDAYVALDRVVVVIDMSLTRSASERAGSLEELMRTGGPIDYETAIRKASAALLALGSEVPERADAEAGN